jgi:hypothetical protein
MGLDVVLYRMVRAGNNRRQPAYVTAQVVADPRDVLAGLIKRVRDGGRTPLLNALDPLGELVVGTEQAPRLLAELRCLGDAAQNPTEADHVRRVTALARRCLHDQNVQLRFEGD